MNVVASLALFKTFIDKDKDYVDAYIPLVATLINQRKYDNLIFKDVCRDFYEYFGIRVPNHPMLEIFNRLKRENLIFKKDNELHVNFKDISKYDVSENIQANIKKQELLYKELIAFAKEKLALIISEEKAEKIFLSYLNDKDLDLLFLSSEKSMIEKVEVSKKDKYLINKFILFTYQSNKVVFQYIIDAIIGFFFAHSIFYATISKTSKYLKNTQVFFDTSFMIRLLGGEGRELEDVNKTFIDLLRRKKIKVKLFSHTFDEVIGIVNDARNWIDKAGYDPTRASPTLRYFKSNEYGKSDIDIFLFNVNNKLKRNNVEVVNTPNPEFNKEHQIDEKGLFDQIVKIYTSTNPYFIVEEKKFTIDRDVKSISAVIKLREGKKPIKIEDIDNIFITANSSLAFAGKIFEYKESKSKFIPACVTEIFWGTALWADSVNVFEEYSVKKVIAISIAALQPDHGILKKFISAVDRLRQDKKISEDEYYFLRTHSTVLRMLEDKSMGDPDAITIKTPEEILFEIKDEIRRKTELQLFAEKEEHESTKRNLKSSVKENERIKQKLTQLADKLGSFVAYTIFITLSVMFIFSFLNSAKIIHVTNVLISWLLIIFYGVCTIMARLLGLNIKNTQVPFASAT